MEKDKNMKQRRGQKYIDELRRIVSKSPKTLELFGRMLAEKMIETMSSSQKNQALPETLFLETRFCQAYDLAENRTGLTIEDYVEAEVESEMFEELVEKIVRRDKNLYTLSAFLHCFWFADEFDDFQGVLRRWEDHLRCLEDPNSHWFDGAHAGDCQKDAMTCMRCHVESSVKEAMCLLRRP